MDAAELKARTRAFAMRVIRLCGALPKTMAADVLGRQLLRAATSVGANYRAACRARSRSEFVSKMAIVEEEADECVYWLELIAESGLVKMSLLRLLLSESDELTAIASASRKTAKAAIAANPAPMATHRRSSNRQSTIDNRQSP